MIQNFLKKLKNIIWYSSHYDFKNNCIVRNKRIDLIDWNSIYNNIVIIKIINGGDK